MRPRWIWLAAVALYAAFTAWYVNWRGPLSPDEVEHHLARIAAGAEGPDAARLDALRAFLERDDGREFYMVNLGRLPTEPVTDPATGEGRPAQEVLQRYTRPFLGRLLLRAGHPAFVGRAAGGYVEHWGVEPDPGWSFAGVIRYRSRRDLVELAGHPGFAAIHGHKLAAMTHTLAFPAAPGAVVLGPRVAVALLLALAAALGHLALQARR